MKSTQKGENTMYLDFVEHTITEFQNLIYAAESREERIFFVQLLNMKMAFEQEKVVGKELL